MGDLGSEGFSRPGPERQQPPTILRTTVQPDILHPLASPNPSLRSNHSGHSDQHSIPPWVRETSAPVYSRPSRSSSVVSTRTRTSINTFQEDTRSVDIQLGGRTFRINRDGSKVSERTEELPPYSPPDVNVGTSNLHSMVNHTISLVSSPFTRNYVDTGVNTMGSDTDSSSPPRGSTSTASELMTPTSPTDRLQSQHDHNDSSGAVRIPSYTPGKGNTQVDKRRPFSQGNSPQKNIRGFPDPSTPPKRRNGLRLPKIVTALPVFRNSGSSPTPGSNSGGVLSPSPSSHLSHSACPSFGGTDLRRPASPTFIGRNATGIFPAKHDKGTPPIASISTPTLLGPERAAQMDEDLLETSVPPAMDSQNDISIHYTRLIRTLDLSHRRSLHERDTELGKMRERVNNIDLAYRKELKIRDTVIDNLSERVRVLETAAAQEAERFETAINRARNEVEDMWEKRWRDKGTYLMREFKSRELELLDKLLQAEERLKEREEEHISRSKPSKFKSVALMVRAAVRFQHITDEDEKTK